MDSDENKYSYWVFTIQAIKGHELPGGQSVARAMRILTEKYLFQLEKATSLHYQGCCKLRIRKRKSTFLNEIVAELDVPRSQVVLAPMQGTWEQAKAYCSKSDTAMNELFTNEVVYSGKDISVLDEKESRFPWQDAIINKLFDDGTSSIKVADDRSIIWVTCLHGGTGKSKLVKWCCYHFDDIVKISFGTSSQLRSALIAAGPRRIYFVDIPRTLGSDDSIYSLMSALEDLKNGYIVSSMYGKNQSLLLDPPHIVVFSNMECPEKMMSADRWDIYMINRDKDLVRMRYKTEGDDIWSQRFQH